MTNPPPALLQKLHEMEKAARAKYPQTDVWAVRADQSTYPPAFQVIKFTSFTTAADAASFANDMRALTAAARELMTRGGTT
jgi:hypothetical protein